MTIKLVSLAAALSVLVTCAAARAQEDKQQTTPPRQPAAGVRAAEPKFRLLRSLSGTKGVDQDGRFLIEDPRSAFYIPDDKQVIVYFEWEGPPGPHRFEGLWRNPEGKVVMMSEFSFDAPDRQFAGYFTMLLGANAPTGLWATEARVDGEAAGVHTFQIIAAARPADALPARRILSRAEIYQRAAAASVFIESLKRTGERQNLGSGFFINEGLVLTTFQALDGAALLRVILPDGRRLETKEVLAWNRRQDWAILKVQSGKVAALGRAAPGSWAVGDRCYSLDVPTEGNRVILEGSLIGKHNPTGAGERLNVSFSPGRWALGSPLLNEYGEVIGLIGGSLIPGAAFLEEIGFANPTSLSHLGSPVRGALAVPITLLPDPAPNAPATTVDELAQSGQFTPPLVGAGNVMSATLSRSVDQKMGYPQPIDQRGEFSRRDGQAALILTWYPKEKRKGIPAVRLYDLDNRVISESKGKGITLKPNKLFYSTWQLNLGGLPPGVYRLDILLDADPVWRIFFRMVE